MNEQFHSQRTVVRSEDFSILAKSSCNFKLEIQKSIFFKSVSGILPTKTTAKLTLNVGRHGCLKSLKQQFFTCLSDWKTSELHLVPRNFYNKRIVVKNCVKTHLKIIKLCGIPHTCRKGSSLLL